MKQDSNGPNNSRCKKTFVRVNILSLSPFSLTVRRDEMTLREEKEKTKNLPPACPLPHLRTQQDFPEFPGCGLVS